MNYNRFKRIADKLLTKYDKRDPKISLTLKRNNSIDPLTGGFVQGSEKTVELTGILSNKQDTLVDGVMTSSGDLTLLITNKVKPTAGDFIIIDGEEYTVSEPVISYNPGGLNLMFEVTLSR